MIAISLGIGISLNIIESFIPLPIAIPGVKLGLANVVTIIILYHFGKREAFLLVLLRVILVGLLRTGLFSISFNLSLAGAFSSYLIMSTLYNKNVFSIVGISVAGATLSGVGQLVLASYLLDSTAIFYYLPYLLFLNIPTGIITGYIARRTLHYLSTKDVFRVA
jgi:heptaprenyl diphosphate synthase